MGSEVANASGKLSPGPGMAAKDVAAHQLARIHSATIGIVAEQGYKALKVRDVTRYAEVSTRAFYELFQSKEDCFLQTYDLISRRASRRIIAAQAGEPDWRRRPQLAFEEFLRGLERKPHDARLALIEAYAASAAALEQAWRAERTFEGMLFEAFARGTSGVLVPSLIVEGIVGGIIWVSKDRLLSGRTTQLEAEGDELVNWTLGLIGPDAEALAHLDHQSVWRNTTLESVAAAPSNGTGPAIGDRALILQATAAIAAANGYAYLTVPRIRTAVGVSLRKFNAYFDDVEDCYLDALDQRTGEALAHAARAQSAAHTWAGGVYRAMAALCEYVGNDAFLVRTFLDNQFPAGPNGARLRQRLTAALTELLGSEMPPVSATMAEASAGALWSLFHHHVIRDWPRRREISATLSYLALAPTLGGPAALAAIRGEQER
jgi:AcrR family transcriptional regulator